MPEDKPWSRAREPDLFLFLLERSPAMTEAQLKAILDATFAYLESKTSQPILKMVEGMANTTLDAEIPAILAYLASKALVVAA